MKTQILDAGDEESLQRALEMLMDGQVIALPTDTVYGVAAHPFVEGGVAGLYEVKGRPPDKAIPLLLSPSADLAGVAREIPPCAAGLIEAFWPGGLTIILPARAGLPTLLTAGGDTIALRAPDHPVPLRLSEVLGVPLAATSANLSGRPPALTAREVEAQLGGSIPLILDGGPAREGTPSTIVDLSCTPPRILRVGAISTWQIRRVLPRVAD